jgi:anaerobic selenocysteine-containing dehydrogenase
MDFRDKDGAPLPAFSDAQGAFDAFRAATRGRPCDYTGISYEKLTGASGIQWPCDERTDVSRERLYQDGVFPTGVEQCELYGHDLETGAAITEEEYRARDPQGRARIKAAHWQPPHEEPDAEFPFWLTTGRVVYHWHTRTKTGRVLALNEAAPTAFVQLATEDAARLGIAEGDLVQVESRRGRVRAPARIGDCAPGCAFMPFHYGGQAANELTLTGGDPVSKQPYVKYAAVRVRKVKP